LRRGRRAAGTPPPPRLAARRLPPLDDPARPPLPPATWACLTRRERETLALALQGLTYAQIAVRLKLSRWTVDGHMRGVLRKCGAASRKELQARLAPGPAPVERQPVPEAVWRGLSACQQQAAALALAGTPVRQAAEALGRSPSSVYQRLRPLLHGCGARTLAQLTARYCLPPEAAPGAGGQVSGAGGDKAGAGGDRAGVDGQAPGASDEKAGAVARDGWLPRSFWDHLTRAEREALALLAEGCSKAQAAARLGITRPALLARLNRARRKGRWRSFQDLPGRAAPLESLPPLPAAPLFAPVGPRRVQLTYRQRQAAALLLDGADCRQMAAVLEVTPEAVRLMLRRLRAMVQAGSEAELAQLLQQARAADESGG
ncbi:MAG: LuxR C-terminal-related transcriptional regulator, partial [Chloroflexota bacterium]